MKGKWGRSSAQLASILHSLFPCSARPRRIRDVYLVVTEPRASVTS